MELLTTLLLEKHFNSDDKPRRSASNGTENVSVRTCYYVYIKIEFLHSDLDKFPFSLLAKYLSMLTIFVVVRKSVVRFLHLFSFFSELIFIISISDWQCGQ